MLLLSLISAIAIYRTERTTVETSVDRLTLQEVVGKTPSTLKVPITEAWG